jgi:two-component system, NarL family, invasion response regulator UvrY
MTAPAEPRATRGLLLVDDHTILREGIRRILEPVTSEWAVTEAATAFQALECLRRQPFALAIVDLSMPGMSGLELIRRIKTEYPQVAVMVLSMHAEEQYAMRAFKAGANGYLTKDSAASELLAAVAKVASGGAYVTASLAERVVQQLSGVARAPRHAELSDRELGVLQRIVAGQRLTDIAQALHLSVKTVSTHKTRIQDKLQLPNMAALIRYGLEHQLDKDDSGFGRLGPSAERGPA